MVRGTGKFKQKRGGGRSFSKNMTLDENGVAVGTDKRAGRRKKKDGEDEEEEDDDDDDEDSDDDDDSDEKDEEVGTAATASAGGSGPAQPELTRTERREQKKKQSKPDGDIEEEDLDLINPNHATGKKLAIADLGKPRELSRREREQKEKREAQERYWKLHREGKTDQAKADLSRLAEIRKDREQAQAKRKAEAEAKAAEAEAKRTAQRKRG